MKELGLDDLQLMIGSGRGGETRTDNDGEGSGGGGSRFNNNVLRGNICNGAGVLGSAVLGGVYGSAFTPGIGTVVGIATGLVWGFGCTFVGN